MDFLPRFDRVTAWGLQTVKSLFHLLFLFFFFWEFIFKCISSFSSFFLLKYCVSWLFFLFFFNIWRVGACGRSPGLHIDLGLPCRVSRRVFTVNTLWFIGLKEVFKSQVQVGKAGPLKPCHLFHRYYLALFLERFTTRIRICLPVFPAATRGAPVLW